jgi:NAD(P)H-nitrite reductase large subunit
MLKSPEVFNERRMSMGEDCVICRCEEVTRKEILKATASGARTVAGVKRRTRAGMGLCQGRTCGRIIAKMIAKYTNKKIEDVLPDKARPPTRPIRLESLCEKE